MDKVQHLVQLTKCYKMCLIWLFCLKIAVYTVLGEFGGLDRPSKWCRGLGVRSRPPEPEVKVFGEP